MKDQFGRTIDYLRISITDRCNLRCRYCMPYGIACVPMREILTMEEIVRIASLGAKLGIRKIKVTGGEPLVRKGCCDLIRMLKAVPGIEQVTMTTNGILLEEHLGELLAAGIDGINISLDTLDPVLYRGLTGGGELEAVLRPLVYLAENTAVPVKVNAVSMNLKAAAEKLGCPYAGQEWRELLALARVLPVDVRFIEMMPIGYGKDFDTISHQELLENLRREYPGLKADSRTHGNGPAVYYQIPGYRGSIGLISAIHGKFCSSCNRVRLTAQGYLKSCLSFDSGADLRRILRDDGRMTEEERDGELLAALRRGIVKKPQAHCFEHPEEMTEHRDMVQIGG